LRNWALCTRLPFDDKPLKPSGIFPEPKPLILEIGFGMGLATWQIALGRPEFNYLGVEVHSPGVGRLLMEIRDRGISNLKIIQHDAVEVLQAMIAPGGLAGLHIFYPDPGRRSDITSGGSCARPGRSHGLPPAPGAYLYFVTDIEDYANQTMEVLALAAH
jgi:tRNA (guanine-N7-)-methyltransferase